MKPKPCEYCGATYHQPYEDGLVECRERLRKQLHDACEAAVEPNAELLRLRAENARLREHFAAMASQLLNHAETCRALAALSERPDGGNDGNG